MAHSVTIRRSAAKQLRKLHHEDRSRIVAAIQRLKGDPYPSGCTSIKGAPGYSRIRIGDYRVVYRVENEVIEIARVGHRSEAYDHISKL